MRERETGREKQRKREYRFIHSQTKIENVKLESHFLAKLKQWTVL